uniref:(northern house mosquito) hypothetical protein n=1 Tax=Culex pipiens TaxID=7175 RepID=A0A8D8K5P8_CULPI
MSFCYLFRWLYFGWFWFRKIVQPRRHGQEDTHTRTHTHGQKRPPGVESLVFLEGGTSSATNFDYGDESFSNRFAGQSNHQSPLQLWRPQAFRMRDLWQLESVLLGNGVTEAVPQ